MSHSSDSANTPQSKTLCLHMGMGLKTSRKINPVQILHWIGLNRHTAIHPQMWRECWAHGDFCKYGLDLSGKCVPRTPFLRENVPLNKQANNKVLECVPLHSLYLYFDTIWSRHTLYRWRWFSIFIFQVFRPSSLSPISLNSLGHWFDWLCQT